MHVKKSSYNVSSRDRHTCNSHHDTWQLQKILGLLELPPLTLQDNQHKVWTQLNSEQSKTTVNQWPMQDFMSLAQPEEYGSQSRNNRGHSPEEPYSNTVLLFFFCSNYQWRLTQWMTNISYVCHFCSNHSLLFSVPSVRRLSSNMRASFLADDLSRLFLGKPDVGEIFARSRSAPAM